MRTMLVVVAALAAASASAAAPLEPGTYRLDMRVASHASLPLVGESGSITASTSLVDVWADGNGLQQRHRVCAATLDGGSSLARIEMPPAFIAALAVHTYPVMLSWDGDGWRYRADLGPEYVGWRPEGDAPLPRRPDDPGVYDWDGDGRPAATLRLVLPIVPDGELYVVQRGHSVLEGRLVSPERVEGMVDVRRFEQAVVASRPGFIARSPAVTQDPSRSRFVLARVAAGTGCDDLASAP